MTTPSTDAADRAAARARLSEDPQGVEIIHRANEDQQIDPDIRESTPEELSGTAAKT